MRIQKKIYTIMLLFGKNANRLNKIYALNYNLHHIVTKIVIFYLNIKFF